MKSEIIHNITLLKLPLLTHAVENSLLAFLRVQLLYSHQKYSYHPFNSKEERILYSYI